MPPRNRKPNDTTDVAAPEFSAQADAETPVEAAVKKTQKPRVKAEDAVILSDIVVTESAPPVTRKSTKDNPFLQHVQLSYEKNLEANDDWLSFQTSEDAADNQCRLIRAAASQLNVGSAVRVGNNTDDGSYVNYAIDGKLTIWFRGQERKARAVKASE